MLVRRWWVAPIVLSLLLPASGHAARVQAPGAWRQCRTDADCELFQVECGYCTGGDVDFDAYNKKWAAEFGLLRQKACVADDAPLPPGDDTHVYVRQCKRNIGPKGHPKCLENACRLVDGAKP